MPCTSCGGTGIQTGCPYCDDPEERDYHTMCFTSQWTCPDCNGSGKSKNGDLT